MTNLTTSIYSGTLGSSSSLDITGNVTGNTVHWVTHQETPSGTEVRMEAQVGDKVVSQSSVKKAIGPSLYFKYVKSKVKGLKQKALKERLSKLQRMVKSAESMNQVALYEELSKMLAVVVRESEAFVCGFDKYLWKDDIDKFMGICKSPVFLKRLEEFPRVIPENVRKKVEAAKKTCVFDEMWVLYLDLTNENIKTNKEKIREKDPILFGKFAYQPNVFYYILDWVDEKCDLTLSKFVETVKESDKDYQLNTIPDMDESYFEVIKKEVMDRQQRLTNTRPGNYKDLMAEEDKSKVKSVTNKKPWWKFWRSV